jgi:hypothetical protein
MTIGRAGQTKNALKSQILWLTGFLRLAVVKERFCRSAKRWNGDALTPANDVGFP